MRIWTKWTYIGAAILWGVALCILAWLVGRFQMQPSETLSPMMVYISALLALAGWMAQAWNAARISRKQHSMNVLFQTRMNAVHKEHLERIGGALPPDKVLLVEQLEEDKALYRSVLYLLNYYEFIAVAIEVGDLDERIIRASIRQQITGAMKNCASVLAWMREENENGEPSDDCYRVYRHLIALNDRWMAYHERDMIREKWQRKSDHWMRNGTWPMPLQLSGASRDRETG